jgi:hypothetical protein
MADMPFRALAHLCEQIGSERFAALIDPANTGRVKRFADELVGVFVLEVNYNLAFEAMIAAGRYDWADQSITAEYFPVSQTGSAKYEAVLVHLDRDASTEEAKVEITQRGLIPASPADLFAFGAKYPDEQRKYPIVALGQSWFDLGLSFFPCLWVVGRGRYLDMRHGRGGWRGACRFLALRKISS